MKTLELSEASAQQVEVKRYFGIENHFAHQKKQ
jgi:hypothetical protein